MGMGRRGGAGVLVVMLFAASWAGAAEVESALGSNIVGGSGFTPGERVDVAVIRDGVTLATAAQVLVDADGAFSVNGPGGQCFSPVTPALRTGDEVHVSTPAQTTVVQVQDLMVGALAHAPGSSVVTLEGRASDTAGQPLPGARIRLWTGHAFAEGPLVQDEEGKLLTAIPLTSPQQAAQAVAIGVAEIVWADPADPTIVSVGQAPGTPEHAPGCPPPAATAVTEVSPSVIGIEDAPGISVSGMSEPSGLVRVSFIDSTGAIAGPFEAVAGASGMWSLTGLDVSYLQSGPLEVSVESQPAPGVPFEPAAGATALLDLSKPHLWSATLNHGAPFSASKVVALALHVTDDEPGSGLFVAIASSAGALSQAALQPFNAELTLTLPGAGAQTVCVRVFDGALNRATGDLCLVVTVDEVPPVFSAHHPQPGAKLASAPSHASVQLLDAAGIDSASIVARINGAQVPFTLGAASLTIPHAFSTGTHVVSVVAKDLAGNAAQTQWSFAVGAPGVQLTSPFDGAAYPVWKPVPLSAITSGAGTKRVELYVGNKLIKADAVAPYQTTWTPIQPGPYTLSAIAVDAAGARTRHGISVYICDAMMPVCEAQALPVGGGPVVQLLSPLQQQSVPAGRAVELVAIAASSAPVLWVRFYVNDRLLLTDAAPRFAARWRPTKKGSHRVRATTLDAKGRTASHEVLIEVK